MGMNPTPLLPEYLTNALENIKMTRKYPKPEKLAQIRRGIRYAKILRKGIRIEDLAYSGDISGAKETAAYQALDKEAKSIMFGPDGDSDAIAQWEFWDDPVPPFQYNETKLFRKAVYRTFYKNYW